MRRAFQLQNRVKIAEINGQIEDNLSGIRVVKSFANEEIEKKKFTDWKCGIFVGPMKNSYRYMGSFTRPDWARSRRLMVTVGVHARRGRPD